MNTKYNNIIRIIAVFIAFQNILLAPAQNGIHETDQKLKKLFFNLNIDSCQNQIIKEIDSNKQYKFTYAGKVDTFRVGGEKYIERNDLWHPVFKLDDNHLSITTCDSTFIQLQPLHKYLLPATHIKTKGMQLYGHRVSVIMYFHDSTSALNAFGYLTDSISNMLGKPIFSRNFFIGNNIAGKMSDLMIDKKNNGYEFERNLEIVIRKYSKFLTVNINFSRELLMREICSD